MKSDIAAQFLSLRRALETERDELTSRLQAVNDALGGGEIPIPTKATRGGRPPKSAAPALVTVAPTAKPGRKPGSRKRAENSMSLKEAVLKAIGKDALTKKEILDGVGKLGYKFTAKNPTNSLNTLLYGKGNKFKNKSGKFSVG